MKTPNRSEDDDDDGNMKMLIIRHMPEDFTVDDRSKLFKYLGALTVKTFSRGPMKNVVFATFADAETASHVLQAMHQYKILGRRLSVEYTKPIHQSYHNTRCVEQELATDKTPTASTITTIPEELKQSNWVKRLLAMAPSLGVNCPMKSSLKYAYPPPNSAILTNISRALAACPAFYTQVLHLMNKMNLPTPFGADIHFPGSIDLSVQLNPLQTEKNVAMDVESSSSESEMSSSESESAHNKKKSLPKVTRLPDLPRIRPSSLKKMSSRKRKSCDPNHANDVIPIQEVFDSTQVANPTRQIQLKLPDSRITNWTEVTPHNQDEPDEGTFGKISRIDVQTVHSEVSDITENQPPLELVHEEEEQAPPIIDFIDPHELVKCRLSSPERSAISVFKNYREGETSCRLYVKNLARCVTESDLKHIYGGFVDWKSPVERQQFDVRYFSEGRMKGQAFVTLGGEEAAVRALQSTNGYLLHDKPMVVQFARGAKAKVDEKSIDD